MLVDYSDSGSESEVEKSTSTPEAVGDVDGKAQRKKRKRDDSDDKPTGSKSLPPLPASFHSLYATNVRTSVVDDPALHGGRKRQVKHTEGNWSSHVYLEWYPSKPELESLDSIIENAGEQVNQNRAGGSNTITIHNLLRSSLGAQLPLHVSLSAPLVLSTEQRTSFQDSVERALLSNRVNQFTVQPVALDWVPNFETTRYFLVLRLSRPDGDELNRLLHFCNGVANQLGQLSLYDQGGGQARNGRVLDRSSAFHISIAWSLHKPAELESENLNKVDLQGLHGAEIKFSTVKVKIGNTVQDIPLAGP